MENNNSTNIRLSLIDDVNNVRRKLWESAYSDFKYNNILTRCLYTAFNSAKPNYINRIDFNFTDLKIGIDLIKPISNIEMNSIITVAFERFVDSMHNEVTINDNEYNIVKGRANMLFSLILNTETKAIISL